MRRQAFFNDFRRRPRFMDFFDDDDFFNDTAVSYLLEGKRLNPRKGFGFRRNPICNVSEDDNNYNLYIELPGAKKENINISVKNDLLEVSVENSQISESSDKDSDSYSYTEKNFSFYRAFALPKNSNSDNINAEYKNGVLTLVIPKKQLTSPEKKLIEVK